MSKKTLGILEVIGLILSMLGFGLSTWAGTRAAVKDEFEAMEEDGKKKIERKEEEEA